MILWGFMKLVIVYKVYHKIFKNSQVYGRSNQKFWQIWKTFIIDCTDLYVVKLNFSVKVCFNIKYVCTHENIEYKILEKKSL